MIIPVGGSFQWPPPKEDEDQGATATPLYLDPKNENIPPPSLPQQQQQQQPARPMMQQPQSNMPQPQQQPQQQQVKSDWDATLNANKARNWRIAILDQYRSERKCLRDRETREIQRLLDI